VSENELLSPAEIARLTGRQRAAAQSRALTAMGVRHILRPDGCVIVSRALVRSMLGRYPEAPPAPAPQRASHINDAALELRRRGRR